MIGEGNAQKSKSGHGKDMRRQAEQTRHSTQSADGTGTDSFSQLR